MNNIKQHFVRPVFSVLQVFIVASLIVFILCRQAQNRINEVFRGSTIPVVELGQESDSPVAEYKYKKNYSFTDDWFSIHIPIWAKALAPFAGKPNLKYLEVGVFEGRAAMWMLEEISRGLVQAW